MTDLELAKFLGIADDERWPGAIAKLDPKKRATYERMADVCVEINLWQAGLAPKPEGVIVCHASQTQVRRPAVDLEKFAQNGAAAQLAVDEASKRAKAVDRNSPREYVLTDPAELQRLFREVRGYLHTCHHKHGTDWEGRKFAIDALDCLIKPEAK